MKKVSLFILSSLLIGCTAKHSAYRLILVEKSRNIYNINDMNVCEISGYDVQTTNIEDGKTTAELLITFKNCEVREKVILDDKTKPMWGIPIQEKPKSKGSLIVQ